ncbi:porin family protein [Rufibacter glacialis]|uniref:PorT family protein n=1 Tax=Rufibacter glacialis TaxID=1259555 RepID=A0A5M8QGV1_9BACT|nr:porin family protein [Rufibacter glacialis]KAA6435307.1 PorT family protein [Rufibacter glacialis]GGK62210.1 hypothetical protein GCM10011405_07900 [Rufibacter glacialis]
MKNFICSLVVGLALAIPSFAQQTPGSLQVGLVAGPSLSYFRGNQYVHGTYMGWENDIRSTFGLSARYQRQGFYLKTNLFYEDKGVKTDIYYTDSNGNIFDDYTAKTHFRFITLPVLVGVHIKESGFFVNAGPYAGFLLKQNYSDNTPDSPIRDNSDNSRDYKRLDLGISGGIGYSKPISSALTLSAEARHNLGLRNISTGPNSRRTGSTSLLLGLHYSLTGN